MIRRDSAAKNRPGPHLSAAPGAGVVILIPVYDDWEALGLLLGKLDDALRSRGESARVLVVDDGSTTGPAIPDRAFRALSRIDILALRRNLGHQRAIAVGLAYVEKHVTCDALVLMDGDGEDDPDDVPRLLDAHRRDGGRKIIFAERTRRSETWAFLLFYSLFKIAHLILTGQRVRVGNFSVVPGERLRSLVVVSEVWNHYPAAVFRSRQPLGMIPTRRARRLSGTSRMNFTRLVVHGLSAMSVYSDVIGVRLLMATIGLMGIAGAGLAAIAGVRLFTDLAIPGWATNALGLMTLILMQAVMFSVVSCVLILGGRQGSSFLPCRDFSYYVGGMTTVFETKHPDSANSEIPRSFPAFRA